MLEFIVDVELPCYILLNCYKYSVGIRSRTWRITTLCVCCHMEIKILDFKWK